jgi:hypothetical protein
MNAANTALVILGVLLGGLVLLALAYFVVRPLIQSAQAWRDESRGQSESRVVTGLAHRRPVPPPSTEGWSPEHAAPRPSRDGRRPIPPAADGSGLDLPSAHLLLPGALDRLREEVLRFQQRTGRSPIIYALNEGSEPQYCLHVNMPIRHASQDANAYLVCGSGFPSTPPAAFVSTVEALDQYGQAQEREMELDLHTIRNWHSDQTLLQVYEEILDRLEDGNLRVSETPSPLPARFDKYGQIVS